MKDLFEDYKRHKSDNQENSKTTLVFNRETKTFEPKQWRDLRVGMIVKVMGDEFFPADMVLCRSSDSKGLAYVETKNLDGETNLKHKVAEKFLNKKLRNQANISDTLDGCLLCQAPND